MSASNNQRQSWTLVLVGKDHKSLTAGYEMLPSRRLLSEKVRHDHDSEESKVTGDVGGVLFPPYEGSEAAHRKT